MPSFQTLVDLLHVSLINEEELRRLVRGQEPGKPGFNQELWDEYQQAIEASAEAARQFQACGHSFEDLPGEVQLVIERRRRR